MQNIGINIRQLRTSKHMTQQQFCDLTGLNRSFLSLVEHGKKCPTKPALKLICLLFHVSEEWLSGQKD